MCQSDFQIQSPAWTENPAKYQLYRWCMIKQKNFLFSLSKDFFVANHVQLLCNRPKHQRNDHFFSRIKINYRLHYFETKVTLSSWIIKRDFWVQNPFAISHIPTKDPNFILICDIIVVFHCSFCLHSDMLVTHFWCPIYFRNFYRLTSVHFVNLMHQLIDQTCWKDRIII